MPAPQPPLTFAFGSDQTDITLSEVELDGTISVCDGFYRETASYFLILERKKCAMRIVW